MEPVSQSQDALDARGDGSMRAMIESHDWSNTPLGPKSAWPERLRLALDLCLGAGVPVAVFWSDDHILFYNDYFPQLIGDKHPAALGRPARDVFTENWQVLGPRLDAVLAEGRPSGAQDEPMRIDRGRGLESCWFSYTLGPIQGDTGKVEGIFHVVIETTESVLAERRQTFLIELAERLKTLHEPTAVKASAAEMLGCYLQVDRVGYAEAEADDGHFAIKDDWSRAGLPNIAGRYPLALAGNEILAAYRAGRTIRVEDSSSHVPPAARKIVEAYAASGVGAGIGVPLVKDGRLVAAFFVNSRQARRWSDAETELVETVAERTWDAVERARSEAQRRESEDRYKTLFNSIDAGFCTVRVIFDKERRPVDYVFLEVNAAFEAQTGLADVIGKGIRALDPAHEEVWFETYGRVALTGEAARFENRAGALDRWFSVYAFRIGPPERCEVAILFEDVSERKREADVLAAELKAMTQLHELSGRVVRSTGFQVLLDDILDATMELHGADFGTVQLYDEATKTLRLAAQRGFDRRFLERFARVGAAEGPAGGMALGRRRRVVVEDVEQEPSYSPALPAARAAGYRAVQSTPLFTMTGDPLGILSTYFRETRRLSEREGRLTDLYARQASDTIAGWMLEQALRESEARLALAVDIAQLGYWELDAASGAVRASAQCKKIFGKDPDAPFGLEDLRAAIHADDLARHARTMEAAIADRSTLQIEYRVIAPNGDIRWNETRGRFEADNSPAGRLVGVTRDVTAGKEHEAALEKAIDRREVLVSELQHRTRNLIGVVRSIARQSMNASETFAAFRERFNERLAALSRVQGLLSRAGDAPITMRGLIDMELRALGTEDLNRRISIEGPDVALPGNAVQTLALAIHELSTNALKYGALASEGGELTIGWRVRAANGEGRRLHLEWNEDGAPTATGSAPGRGFGRELIEQALPYQLQARTSYEVGGDGVRCSIDLPLDKLAGAI